MINSLRLVKRWGLGKFPGEAGDSIESPNLQPIAKEVANESGGLPLAIAIVGKAPGDKD